MFGIRIFQMINLPFAICKLFPNLLYYVVKGDYIIIVAIVHYRQSPATIERAVMRALESYR